MSDRYGSDTYYLQARDAFAAAGVDAEVFARRHALLLLKPDAAITGAMRPAVAWLLEHGYRITGAYAVSFTPLHLRALWYFSWQRATPQRRLLADRLAGLSPAVVLVVTHPDDTEPVSARLTAQKGPADPALREAGQLRSALSAGTYLLNLVHSADDPDDVLRELGVYFSESELAQVIPQLSADPDASAEAYRVTEAVESGVVRRSGEPAAARAALQDALSAAGLEVRPLTAEQWLDALAQADRRGIVLDPWFRLVVESAYLPMHRS